MLREAEGGYCLALCVSIATGGVGIERIVFFIWVKKSPYQGGSHEEVKE